MQVDLFEIMTQMYRARGVNVVLIWDMEAEASGVDMGFRGKMAKGFGYAEMLKGLFANMEAEVNYLIEDDLGMYYSFFRFGPEKERELHCRLLCLGPVLFRQVGPEEFERLMDKRGIDPIYRPDFQEFFNQTPVVGEYDAWNHGLGFFLTKLCGRPPAWQHVEWGDESWTGLSTSYADYSIPSQPDVALEAVEQRYKLEQEMMDMVAEGNFRRAYELYCRFKGYRLFPRVSNPVRNQKNLSITLNTLLRKAAQAGYVHPFHIDNLSRQLAIRIEASVTMEQLDALGGYMIRKYCMLVNNYSRRSYSSLVQACMDYIDFHYSEELSLSSLAGRFSSSESYLSSLFRKETGMTVTDYINTTRLRQALVYLNASAKTVGEIASACGFFDANYFSRLFKKYYGTSPRQYRREIRRDREAGEKGKKNNGEDEI